VDSSGLETLTRCRREAATPRGAEVVAAAVVAAVVNVVVAAVVAVEVAGPVSPS